MTLSHVRDTQTDRQTDTFNPLLTFLETMVYFKGIIIYLFFLRGVFFTVSMNGTQEFDLNIRPWHYISIDTPSPWRTYRTTLLTSPQALTFITIIIYKKSPPGPD